MASSSTSATLSPGVTVMRFKNPDGSSRVPKSAGFYGGGNDRYLQDDGSLSANVIFPFREKPHVYPYTGNGFAASKDGVLRPELHIGERVPLPHGTTLTKRNAAGEVTAVFQLERGVDELNRPFDNWLRIGP